MQDGPIYSAAQLFTHEGTSDGYNTTQSEYFVLNSRHNSSAVPDRPAFSECTSVYILADIKQIKNLNLFSSGNRKGVRLATSYYHPHSKGCGKVMFSQVSVCTQGGYRLVLSRSCLGRSCPGPVGGGTPDKTRGYRQTRLEVPPSPYLPPTPDRTRVWLATLRAVRLLRSRRRTFLFDPQK